MLCDSKDVPNCNIFKCRFVQFSSEIMKKVFYLTLKALFVLKIFEVLSWFSGNVEKRLEIIETTDYKTYTIKIEISTQHL